MQETLTQIPATQVALVVALVLVLLQEAVNGFHDKASTIRLTRYEALMALLIELNIYAFGEGSKGDAK